MSSSFVVMSRPLAAALAGLAASAASAAFRPDLTRAFPAPGATQVCPDTPLRLSLGSPAALSGTGRIEVHDAGDGSVVAAIDTASPTETRRIGGASYNVYPVLIDGGDVIVAPPPGALAWGRSYVVTVEAGVFRQGTEPSAAIGAADGWRFTTKAAPPARDRNEFAIAADGSGDFCTVQGAVDYVPERNARAVELVLHPGIYREMVHVPPGRNGIALRGTDRKRCVIAYANNARFNPAVRALFDVEADGFTLENLTLRNTTPKGGSQAEALRVRADRCVLARCDFSSLQDTLQLTGRVYVDACFVEGDVDYVWGSGSVYFNRCELKSLNDGYLVQARNDAGRPGYVFVDCTLSGAPGITRYVLARIDPGRFPYSHVAFIGCAMGDFISPVGWQFDGAPASTAHIRFEEFQSTDLAGHPLDVSRRHPASRQLSAAEAAAERDVANVLGGWRPSGVN